MRPPPLRSLLVGLAAAVLVLGACNAIFGIELGSPAGSGGAGETGDAGDSGSTSDAGDSGSTSDAGDAGSASEGGGCGDTGFPTTPVLDDFNRANGGLGPQWSVDTPGAYGVAGDQLVCSAGTPGIMVWSATFGPSQEAYITIVSMDPGDAEIELILKNQGTITECDSLQIDYQPNGAGSSTPMLGIYGCTDSGTQTFVQFPLTLGTGDTLGARACADGTIQVFKNGTLVHAPFDASAFPFATMGGRIGFYTSGLTVAARLDDFGGGTVP